MEHTKSSRHLATHDGRHQPWLEKILRWCFYGIAFIPLIIFSQYLSPFHFGKAIIFRSVVEIMSILYLALIMQDRSYLPRRTPVFIATSIFIGLYGLTSFLGFDPYQSIWGSLERMGGFYSMFHFWLLFVMMLGILRTKKDWLLLIKFSIIASILSAFYGFLQKTNVSWVVGSGDRVKIFGTIGNPALFAGYILCNAFLALIFFFDDTNSKMLRYYMGIAFVINSIGVFLSGVRGSLLGLVAGTSFFVLSYTFLFGSGKLKRFVVVSALCGVVLVSLVVVFHSSDFIKNNEYLSRFSDFSPNSYTVQTRFWTWTSGFKGWVESPRTMLIGYGPENFNIPFLRHFDPRHFRGPGSETLFDRAHNMFFEILFTMGILGELAYLAMFGVLLSLSSRMISHEYRLMKKKTHFSKERMVFGLAFISVIIGYLIHNFFIFDTTANYIAFFFIVGLINFIVFEDSEARHSLAASTHVNPVLKYSLLIATSGLVVFSIYTYNIKPALANYATTRGIIFGWQTKLDDALGKFDQAFGYHSTIQYDILNRYSQFLVEQASTGAISPKLQAAVQSMIQEEGASAQLHSHDNVPVLYMSRLNIILGKNDPQSPYNKEALKDALHALELSPTFVRTYFEVAQVYLNMKDYPNAIKYFQGAIALNPVVGLSHWYLGSTLLDSGDSKQGLAELQKAIDLGYGPTENDYLRLVNILTKKNDIANLAVAYAGLVKLDPSNIQYVASLATAYARLGKNDLAIQQARAAVKIDPKFEPQARAFIEGLGGTY